MLEKIPPDIVRDLENQAIFEFDENYWLKKTLLLKKTLEEQESSDDPSKNKKKDMFLYELYFTKIHCCETLLRNIIIAKHGFFRPLIPLIELSQSKFQSELTIMENGIDWYINNSEKFFYDNFYPINQEDEKVKDSIDFIKKAINLIIKEYSNRQASNVFKHGFYGSLSKENTLSTKDLPYIRGQSANMLNWYEINKKENNINLEKKSLSVSPQREVNIIKITTSILEQFFKIKRAIIKQDKKMTFSFFTQINLEKTFSIYTYDNITMDNFKLSFPIELPKKFPFYKLKNKK